MPQVVTFSLFRFDSLHTRIWAFSMMGLARGQLRRTPGIGFWKLCGSGTGEGFTPVPNTGVYAILATWPDAATARDRINAAPIYRRYRKRAAADWTVFMQATSARGNWSGETPFDVLEDRGNGPLAALTRATIRPSILHRFWGRVPDISAAIGSDPNVLFKIGIGEVPMLHQITFSIWPDARRMAQFARTGAHADAICAVREEGWFREELYARFTLLSEQGAWGHKPLFAELEPS